MMLILMFSTAQIWLPCLPWVQPCLDDLALAVGLPRSVESPAHGRCLDCPSCSPQSAQAVVEAVEGVEQEEPIWGPALVAASYTPRMGRCRGKDTAVATAETDRAASAVACANPAQAAAEAEA